MKVKCIEGQISDLGSTDELVECFEKAGFTAYEVYHWAKNGSDIRGILLQRGISGSLKEDLASKFNLLSIREQARLYFLEKGYCNDQIDVLIKAKESGVTLKELVAVAHPYINSWNMKDLLNMRGVKV